MGGRSDGYTDVCVAGASAGDLVLRNSVSCQQCDNHSLISFARYLDEETAEVQ